MEKAEKTSHEPDRIPKPQCRERRSEGGGVNEEEEEEEEGGDVEYLALFSRRWADLYFLTLKNVKIK